MEDSRLIENLIYTYARLIDAGDLAGVAELFRDGEIISPAHDMRFQGYDEVLALYQASCRLHEPSATPLTRHITTNVIIEIDTEAAEARASAYYTVIQATDSLPLQPIITGHYVDQFRKSGEQWTFKSREMHVDMVGDCSEHLLYDASGLA